MIPGSLARRYARALLDLAKSPMQRDKFATDLAAFAELGRQRDEAGTSVLTVLTAERFPLAQRRDLLHALARRVAADPIVLKFLELVLEKGRINGLPDISRAYGRLADEAAGRLQAELTSATPLSPDAVSRIRTTLEQVTGKQVVTTTLVDPEIIGGIIAKVGSYVIDGSVRASLAQLRTSLKS